jgi:hypothetical protein
MAKEQENPPSTANNVEQVQPSQSAVDIKMEPSQKRAENDTLPEESAVRVRQTIRDAHELLEFAVADGLTVEPAIIEDIQKALRWLDPSRPLTWQECSAFEQAYQKLARTLSPLTIEEVRREARPWDKKAIGKIVLPLVLFGYPLFLLGQMACRNCTAWLNGSLCTEQEMGIGAVGFGLFFVIFLWWGTKPLTGAVTNRKLNQLIKVCYIFTLLALLLSFLPFVSMSFFPMLPRILTLSPINVLQGCADPWPADGVNPAEIPKEIRCVKDESVDKPSAYQWLVNIGGEVVPVRGYQKREGEAQSCSMYSEDFREDRWRIQGGLVVPLYVIVLALMGSAVSMTRRVPEYQRRAFGSHETLSNAQARENLVFQIMQVFSAPLIVMAAYYLFAPDTRTTSVLVGFASGFASEPILLAIRSLADKLKPAENGTSASPSLVSVSIDPSSAQLSPGQSQQMTATVTNSANGAVIWSTDPPNIGTLTQTGLYTAPATIPAVSANRTITILAVSAADPTKRGSAMVSLIP